RPRPRAWRGTHRRCWLPTSSCSSTDPQHDGAETMADNMWPQSRREWLGRMGTGLGALGLAALLDQEGQAATNPLAAQKPPLPAKAKRVLHLFMNGGPSQVDTFDPKPALAKYAGQMPKIAGVKTERRTGGLMPSPFKFAKHGKSGIEVSEIFPHVA